VIALTQKDVLAHEVVVPWSEPYQVEQDLLLVAVGDRPEGHIRKALLRVLRPVLGRERSSVWDSVQLAVRNAAKDARDEDASAVPT
jgi:hypothetical protein